MNPYHKYLTDAERRKIRIIEDNMRRAGTVKEVNLYSEQIGLIMERMIIRKKHEMELKNATLRVKL